MCIGNLVHKTYNTVTELYNHGYTPLYMTTQFSQKCLVQFKHNVSNLRGMAIISFMSNNLVSCIMNTYEGNLLS